MQLEVAERVDFKSSHHTHPHAHTHCNSEVIDMLTNLIVVIILQYIGISNYYIVHLKITQCYMPIISIHLRKAKTKNKSGEKTPNFAKKERQQWTCRRTVGSASLQTAI